ncbi:hypothetical protein RO1_22680 [Roseburia intestinalis XB6B4]|uniref:Uncharacterized protein n=1 Tax=Roseburia intestinalis XB6B4 TaxID=718255 RepID=D4KZI3_9FIRM|nr:hypothetical protein RO1_22680 [Roseburia intestinalis XB6B4]
MITDYHTQIFFANVNVWDLLKK